MDTFVLQQQSCDRACVACKSLKYLLSGHLQKKIVNFYLEISRDEERRSENWAVGSSNI